MRAWDPGRKLPKEREGNVRVQTLAHRRHQQGPPGGLLIRIIELQQWCESVVPFGQEVEAPLTVDVCTTFTP